MSLIQSSNKSASATVDSLLSEIDQEIPPHATQQIPLEEVGDETMEKVVHHNTRSNSSIGVQDFMVESVRPLVESNKRKSVMFSEDFRLHEYPLSELPESPVEAGNKLPVVWSLAAQSSEHNSTSAKGPPRLAVPEFEDEESENYDSDEPFQLGQAELRANTVLDLREKLTYIHEGHQSSPNVPRLKEMVNDIDRQATMDNAGLETEPLKIMFESTRPLLGDSNELPMLEFDVESQGSLDDQIFSMKPHSPTKIPTTNTIRIDRLNTTQMGTPARVSSGSSVDESETDLETTMRQDRFQLLRSPAQPKGSLAPKASDFEISNKSLLFHEGQDNGSRVFSMATTADEFQSARENGSLVTSEDESQFSESIEDLQISTGMVREEGTLQDLDHFLGSSGYERSGSRDNRPDMPFINSSFADRLVQSNSTLTVKRTSLQNLKGVLPESDTESSIDEKGEIVSPSSSESKTPKDQVIPDDSNIVTESPKATSSNEQDTTSCSVEEGGDTEVIKSSEEKDDMVSINDDVDPESQVGVSELGLLPSIEKARSVSNTLSNLFDDEGIFGDIGDTSQDSLDITTSLKPSDYLSIWRSQKEYTRPSPTLSANSQFSQSSNVTRTSSVSAPSKFKLKPRIISRSKIYYPPPQDEVNPRFNEDVYVSKVSGNSILDPLRRNTKVSRKIQEQFPSRRPLLESEDSVIKSQLIETKAGEEQTLTEDVDIENSYERSDALSENDLSETENEQYAASIKLSMPEVSGDNLDVSEELGNALRALNYNNITLKEAEDKSKASLVFHIWDKNNYQNGIDLELGEEQEHQTKQVIEKEVLTKLLSEGPETTEKSTEDSPFNVFGQLKNTDGDIAICRTDSFKGFEVVRSMSTESVQHNFDHFPHPHTPSPAKKMHVDSPFKIVGARKMIKETGSPTGESKSSIKASKNEAHPLEFNLASHNNSTASTIEGSRRSSKSSKLKDNGKLYVLINSIQNIKLSEIGRHNPKISMEFDNGTNIVQTPWQPLTKDSAIINQEYELIMDDIEPEKIPQIVITMKCRYDRPESELVEHTERIPMKKKLPFGKKKYTLRKTFLQKKVEVDEWDNKFAKDGSFARCTIPMNSALLHQASYNKKELNFLLYNEWERDTTCATTTSNVHQLPRKEAYKIGELSLTMCYLPRTSNLEKFPKTLQLAQDVVSKYAEQQNIKFEGFLWQEGGDVETSLQKRYFVLRGTQLIAHHEISKKPRALINLLKVVSVIGEGKLTETNVKKVRNFSDVVLFSECLKLVFENGEVINLDAESTELKEKWTDLLTRVVELNKFHQPWVKNYLNNRVLTL